MYVAIQTQISRTVAEWRRVLDAGAAALHAFPAHGSKKDVATTGKTAGVSQLGDFCAEGERASQRLRCGARALDRVDEMRGLRRCGPVCLAQRRATLQQE